MSLASDRGEDQEDEARRWRGSGVAAVVVAARGCGPPPNIMKRMPRSDSSAIDADHRDGQRRHEDVVVLDVAQLVGEDAFELDAVHLLEQPGGDGDGGVLRVAAGGEGVRRRVVDDVHPRLGQAAGDARPSTRLCSRAYSCGSAGLARLTARATASDFQYDSRREPTASTTATTTTEPIRTLNSQRNTRDHRRAVRRARRSRRSAARSGACSG